MTNKQTRVRFAPSPTGNLHIGGVRTALFNWLLARNQKGKFLLRIEDTDEERSTKAFESDILESLKWLGLDWDEPIVYQSSRKAHYQQVAKDLASQGHLYACSCTPEEVEAMREIARKAGKKPMYDGRCREKKLSDHSKDVPLVYRAKIPREGTTSFDDLIRGQITIQNEEIDDFVVVRSTGVPTYHFVVVVDDAEMEITHVVRGDDHINNTPKQIHLYQFLSREVPAFAHLPMILGADKKKLSKRHGDVSTLHYRDHGYLPDALLNFLVRLGWSSGDQEVFSRKEMIDLFSLKSIQKSSAVFNAEKLDWLNGSYLREASPEWLAGEVERDFGKHFSSAGRSELKTDLGRKLISLVQPKVKRLTELAEWLAPLCEPAEISVSPEEMEQVIWKKKPELREKIVEASLQLVDVLRGELKGERTLGAAGLDQDAIGTRIKEVVKNSGLKFPQLMQPVRIAVTGRAVSVGMFELLEFYPWDRVEVRIRQFFQ